MSDLESRPSIRLRRTPSSVSANPTVGQVAQEDNGSLQVPGAEGGSGWGRPRSSSAASRLGRRLSAYLPRLEETPQSPTTETGRPTSASGQSSAANKPLPDLPEGTAAADGSQEYESNLVDLLDLIDPEVQTLSTLTNLQNSLFVPDLGRFVNRRPSYALTRPTYGADDSPAPNYFQPSEPTGLERTPTSYSLTSITSRQTVRHYAVLPHGVKLQGWDEEDRRSLDDHVRHMLHSRRSKFKRSMKGFGQYIKRPLGFFITLYAVLITLFGLIWVLFLIGWVNVGGRKTYIINVIDNILVALFAIMGDGLAPFRVVDTYHMIFIAHYHHLTWRLRREKALPKLQDRNDLPPLPPVGENEDIESQTHTQSSENRNEIGIEDIPEIADIAKEESKFRPSENQFSVLTIKQQANLLHHQKKFNKSHTFYKPHETYTHHAFPLRLLVAIVVLLDCHSLLQISLGTCTWAISYHHRPFALTTVILCCSITVNITAGILISVGDHKTRKKDVMEKLHRQELTAEAMKKLEKKKAKELRRTSPEQNGPALGHEGSTEVTIPELSEPSTPTVFAPVKPPPTLNVPHR